MRPVQVAFVARLARLAEPRNFSIDYTDRTSGVEVIECLSVAPHEPRRYAFGLGRLPAIAAN